jgi:UDP-N-acetylmuramate dehydrogenase
MEHNEIIEIASDTAIRLGCKPELGAKLSDYTSFKIGGKVPLLINISNLDALIGLLKLLAIYKAPFMVIGNGTNILADDSDHNLIILRINSNFAEIKQSENLLTCLSGTMLSNICRIAMTKSLSGLEPLTGIPGTIGGAVYMNAGAYGRELSDIVESVTAITAAGNLKTYSCEECLFSYRESIFMHNNETISSVKLRLSPGEMTQIKSQMSSYTKRRREKQPLEFPSAGSAFKRPKGAYASALIDECGLKGLAVGGAKISEKHAGFIINTGDATFRDVITLMKKVIGIVELQTGFKLEPEPIILSNDAIDF